MKKNFFINNFLVSIILLVIILSQISLFASEEKISIQLKWYNQFQFAGFYIAKEKGFYKEKNLDVEIKEIEKNTNIVNDVISGKSTYGIGSSSLLIDYNKNLPVAAIAAIFQHSPSVLITTSKDIFEPKDYGFDFYGDILFTSQDEIKNHPNRVKAFYEATKKRLALGL